MKSVLRPIALTSCLVKVLEGFTYGRLLKQVNCDVEPRQYAREGHSTTQALIYLLHAITRQLTQETAVLAYVCRLLKGFDTIDQNILH